MRVYQILIPAIALIYILWQFRRLHLAKALWKNIWPGILFAVFIAALAIFPNFITRRLAKFLDFKSNVNAILFFLIGVLFVAVIQLYNMYNAQQKTITKLTMELSVLIAEKTKTVP